MKHLPIIIVREFAGLTDISYRIASGRARNYWQFLEHVHNTFNKPWERYNAHLHLDNTVCDGRVSQSEWDAGGYFEGELVVDGRLVLYAHFEELESRKAKMREDVDEDEDGWGWGWHGARDGKDEWYGAKDVEDDGKAFEGWDKDPYPPFPERLPLDHLVYNTTYEFPITPAETPPDLLPTPSISPTTEFVVVNEPWSHKHQETGIVIGNAKPHCCRDPKQRPTVRAIATSNGRLMANIPAKYANSTKKLNGDVLIALSDVDFIPSLEKIPSGEQRQKAIWDALLEAHDAKRRLGSADEGDFSQRIIEEGVVIGHAKPDRCRNPTAPPIVRAMLNSTGAVISFIQAKDSKRSFKSGMAQIHLRDVDYTEHLGSVPLSRRSQVIKGMILERKDAKDQGAKETREKEAGEEKVKKTPKGNEQKGDVKVRDKEELMVDVESKESIA